MLHKYLIIILFSISQYSIACTSFFIQANDTMLFGNTMDINVGDGYLFINKRNVNKTGLWYSNAPSWTSKYASVTTNMWGREFPARGINEAGLVMGEMNLPETVYPSPDSRYCMELVQYMQYILDNCSTIEDVLEFNEIVRIDQGQYESHFLLSDANGNSLVIEWLNGIQVSYYSGALPVSILTNDTYESLLEYYNAGVPPVAGNVSSKARFYNAADMAKTYNSEIDGSIIDYGFKILGKVENPGFTKWRLLFDITNKRLYFDTYNNKNRRYIDLNYFDLSCSGPVKMINLYNTPVGNINADLFDFDYNVNKVHLESYALKAGYGSPSWLSSYYDFPASTTCMGDTDIHSEVFTRQNSIIKSVMQHNDMLQITIKPAVSGIIILEFYNLSGSIVKTVKNQVLFSEENNLEIHTESIPEGLYILKITDNKSVNSQKVIIL